MTREEFVPGAEPAWWIVVTSYECVCVCVSVYSIYHTCLSWHSSFDFLMLIITSSCECCESLLRFYTRHPERAVKLWFIAVTHLWGLCYTRFITIAAVKVHQEAKSSHHHHLTWADVVQPIKSNHYLMTFYIWVFHLCVETFSSKEKKMAGERLADGFLRTNWTPSSPHYCTK